MWRVEDEMWDEACRKGCGETEMWRVEDEMWRDDEMKRKSCNN